MQLLHKDRRKITRDKLTRQIDSSTCFAGIGVREDQRLDGFLGHVIQTGHTGAPGPRERGRVVSICGEAIQYTQR